MSHLTKDRAKLIHRIHRIQGQLEGVVRLLGEEHECAEVLQIIASCRGAINGLMVELLESHIRFHVLDGHGSKSERTEAGQELIDVVRSYLK